MDSNIKEVSFTCEENIQALSDPILGKDIQLHSRAMPQNFNNPNSEHSCLVRQHT